MEKSDQQSLCTKYCDGCHYRKIFHGAFPYCDYLLMTGERRPCPAGDGCTVRVKRRVYRKKVLTPEQQAAKAAEQREKRRIRDHERWLKNKDELNAKRKAWNAAHKEHLREYRREYRRRKKEEEKNGVTT